MRGNERPHFDRSHLRRRNASGQCDRLVEILRLDEIVPTELLARFDRTSRYQADEVRDLAKRLNVPIHAILTGEPEVDELHELATSVGGTAHILEDLATLPAVYARIEAALRAQILAFIRTDPATRENEWRTISVEVGGFVVQAPQGYYATW